MRKRYTVPLLAAALIFLSGCAAALPLLSFVQPLVRDDNGVSLLRVGTPAAHIDLLTFGWSGASSEESDLELPVIKLPDYTPPIVPSE